MLTFAVYFLLPQSNASHLTAPSGRARNFLENFIFTDGQGQALSLRQFDVCQRREQILPNSGTLLSAYADIFPNREITPLYCVFGQPLRVYVGLVFTIPPPHIRSAPPFTQGRLNAQIEKQRFPLQGSRCLYAIRYKPVS